MLYKIIKKDFDFDSCCYDDDQPDTFCTDVALVRAENYIAAKDFANAYVSMLEEKEQEEEEYCALFSNAYIEEVVDFDVEPSVTKVHVKVEHDPGCGAHCYHRFYGDDDCYYGNNESFTIVGLDPDSKNVIPVFNI